MTRRYTFASHRGGIPPGRAGLYALSWPLITVVLALGAMRGTVTGLTDPATPLVAGLLFLLAVPTTWIFAVLHLAPVVDVALGVITSFPLWFFLGTRLALVSWSWGQFWARYVASAIGWAVAAMVALAVIASIAG